MLSINPVTITSSNKIILPIEIIHTVFNHLDIFDEYTRAYGCISKKFQTFFCQRYVTHLKVKAESHEGILKKISNTSWYWLTKIKEFSLKSLPLSDPFMNQYKQLFMLTKSGVCGVVLFNDICNQLLDNKILTIEEKFNKLVDIKEFELLYAFSLIYHTVISDGAKYNIVEGIQKALTKIEAHEALRKTMRLSGSKDDHIAAFIKIRSELYFKGNIANPEFNCFIKSLNLIEKGKIGNKTINAIYFNLIEPISKLENDSKTQELIKVLYSFFPAGHTWLSENPLVLDKLFFKAISQSPFISDDEVSAEDDDLYDIFPMKEAYLDENPSVPDAITFINALRKIPHVGIIQYIIKSHFERLYNELYERNLNMAQCWRTCYTVEQFFGLKDSATKKFLFSEQSINAVCDRKVIEKIKYLKDDPNLPKILGEVPLEDQEDLWLAILNLYIDLLN